MTERGHLTEQQVRRGMNPVRADRIDKVQGLSYVPAEEVRAELIRQFGPGNWDSQVIDLTLLFENQAKSNNNKEVWDVCYRAGVQLNVRDYDGQPIATFVEYHNSTSRHPERGEAHGNAMTAASSYALRRCAIGLGDNYGLHLYHKGQTEPLVRGTLLLTERLAPKKPEPVEPTPEPLPEGADPRTGELPPAPGEDPRDDLPMVLEGDPTPATPEERAAAVEKIRAGFNRTQP